MYSAERLIGFAGIFLSGKKENSRLKETYFLIVISKSPQLST